jgi:hypothetical protein
LISSNPPSLRRALSGRDRFLDAAEGHDLVRENALVDADHAGIELLGDAPARLKFWLNK